MNEALVLGIACVAAAIVGGGLKWAGVELPAISSLRRQTLLALFGAALIVFSVVVGYDQDRQKKGAGTPPESQPPVSKLPVEQAPTVPPSKSVQPAPPDSPAKVHAATTPEWPPKNLPSPAELPEPKQRPTVRLGPPGSYYSKELRRTSFEKKFCVIGHPDKGLYQDQLADCYDDRQVCEEVAGHNRFITENVCETNPGRFFCVYAMKRGSTDQAQCYRSIKHCLTRTDSLRELEFTIVHRCGEIRVNLQSTSR